ncbi:hypothetical protein [Dyadobacter frigoris]|uniref:Uncharacterized protein n=1 Tax=Dyadobacter frigoris TaxID=2576211 RepID=A0A4U6D205_9BACT|nr:hypothetical protein [Dyadobacter frigoris]TKT91182.1 hypothetical protein FDK13_16155 [Dyadobacter frigoris]GLU55114.1 hypothetical protein Dfri01_45750 [Dyadobacter frigoris]
MPEEEYSRKKMLIEVHTNIIDAQQKEYDERYKNWSAKALEQLGFTNNLIITLSVAFLGFLFTIDNAKCNNKCFYITIIIVCCISILFGILAMISRLYDFKITRNITLIRKIYFKKNNVKRTGTEKGKLPHSQKGKNSLLDSFYVVLKVFFYDIDNLSIEMSDLIQNFKKRSELSNSLGFATWRFFKLQTGVFVISILLYLIFYLKYL